MNIKEESTAIKFMIIDQWVAEGMSREDAIALFKEMAAFV